MDEQAFEMAAAQEEAVRQRAIESRVQYQGGSAQDCQDCGAEIPLARRHAVPGCQYCIDCQQMIEVRR